MNALLILALWPISGVLLWWALVAVRKEIELEAEKEEGAREAGAFLLTVMAFAAVGPLSLLSLRRKRQ